VIRLYGRTWSQGRRKSIVYSVLAWFRTSKRERESLMERRRPESISLPPMRHIFEQNLTVGSPRGGGGGGGRQESDTWHGGPPKTAPLTHYLPPISPYPSDRAPRICGQHRSSTPPSSSQRSVRGHYFYPSPTSDHHLEDAEMAEAGSHYLHAATTPLFSSHVDNAHARPVPQRKLSAVEMQRHPSPTTAKPEPLTPSIVHYRPEGIPASRQRRASIQKAGTKKSTELKIRMVKWDRVTDKGTAPLKTDSKSAPRACTLCHLTRRKVPLLVCMRFAAIIPRICGTELMVV